MGNPQKLDPEKVADLATRIAAQVLEVARCRVVATNASNDLNGAECRLHNLESEFTRAVDLHLDRSLLTGVRHERLGV